MKLKVAEIVGNTTDAQPILDILSHTTVVAGGTFITKDYDKTPNIHASTHALEQLSRDINAVINKGKMGVIATRRPGS